MFHQLLESGASAPPRSGWAVVSSAAHATLIAAAIALTMREPLPEIERRVETVLLAAPRPVRPAAERSTAPARPVSNPILHRELHLPFPTVPPVGIPEPSARLSDPTTDIIGRGLTGPIGPVHLISDSIHTGATVDRAVIPRRDNAQPDYPGALRAAQVEGSVIVQFVVDTTGRVEPGSVQILRTTHAQFGDAVRRWLTRTRYSPAEASGVRVRQLVQQEVGFTLQR